MGCMQLWGSSGTGMLSALALCVHQFQTQCGVAFKLMPQIMRCALTDL